MAPMPFMGLGPSGLHGLHHFHGLCGLVALHGLDLLHGCHGLHGFHGLVGLHGLHAHGLGGSRLAWTEQPLGFLRSGLKEWAAGLSLGHLAAACRMYIVQWL